MREHTSANYEIPGAMKLEQEQIARSQRFELARAARLPEIDFDEVDYLTIRNCGRAVVLPVLLKPRLIAVSAKRLRSS